MVAESSGTWSLEVGERNPADTLTKPLPGRRIREWSEHVGQRWLQQSKQKQEQRMMENIVKDAW